MLLLFIIFLTVVGYIFLKFTKDRVSDEKWTKNAISIGGLLAIALFFQIGTWLGVGDAHDAEVDAREAKEREEHLASQAQINLEKEKEEMEEREAELKREEVQKAYELERTELRNKENRKIELEGRIRDLNRKLNVLLYPMSFEIDGNLIKFTSGEDYYAFFAEDVSSNYNGSRSSIDCAKGYKCLTSKDVVSEGVNLSSSVSSKQISQQIQELFDSINELKQLQWM